MLKRWAAFLIIALWVPSAATADQADDYVRQFMARSHAPGVALAVIRNGRVVKSASYGLANVEWKQPVTSSSPFWLDSLTKLFTAVGVMQLAEQGKLSLDDPITKYLTDAPTSWHEVTIMHLLAHTSGIKDDYWQQYSGSYLVEYKGADIYKYATAQPFEFRPGERYAYNNEGYYLLGVIISKVTGEPYTRWITDHVLRPAGMKTATMYNPYAIVPQMASSYALREGKVVHNRADILVDRGEAIAGWGLFASLDDMIAFDSALRGGRLLSAKSLQEMWNNATLNDGTPSKGGLGFGQVDYVRGVRDAVKGGQAGVQYDVFPDNSVSVIFLTNMESSGWESFYSDRMVASFFAPEIQPLSSLKARPDSDRNHTDRVLQALKDIAYRDGPSPRLTKRMNAEITPEHRSDAKQLLGSGAPFQFLGCERPGPHDPHAVAMYCYYRVHSPRGVLDLSFGLTARGQLAAVTGQPE